MGRVDSVRHRRGDRRPPNRIRDGGRSPNVPAGPNKKKDDRPADALYAPRPGNLNAHPRRTGQTDSLPPVDDDTLWPTRRKAGYDAGNHDRTPARSAEGGPCRRRRIHCRQGGNQGAHAAGRPPRHRSDRIAGPTIQHAPDCRQAGRARQFRCCRSRYGTHGAHTAARGVGASAGCCRYRPELFGRGL